MSTEQTNVLKPVEAKYVKITDEKIIAELNKLDLYVPPHETTATYDTKQLKEDRYKKSAGQVVQLRPIEDAVWFDDPQKD